MNELTIGTPFITKNEKYTRLSAQITADNNTFELWYEVSNEYSTFLCSENCDAFLVALLPYAMSNNLNIICEGAVSAKLHFNICFNLIPLLSKHSKIFKKITVKADKRNNKIFESAFSNATGISCGVDSFNSILSANAFDDEQYKLTHLTFFNVGSHKSTSNYNSEQSAELFKSRSEASKRVAEKINTPMVKVNSNLGDYLNLPYVKIHHFCSFSAVLALQKLFKHYYYSSGYEIENFSIDKCDKGSAFYEPLLAQYLSTETTEFFILGLEKTRIEKLEFISNFEIAQNHLNVCYHYDSNCGVCEKCLRTQFELYSINKLKCFENVFDLSKFYAKYDFFINHMLKHQNSADYNEILNKLKQNNIKLSFKNRIKKFLYSIAIKFL